MHQLECLLAPPLAEELSSLLEEEVLSLSWYETDSKKWMFQAILSEEQRIFVENKIKGFLKEKGMECPLITTKPLAQKDWVSLVYQDFPPLSIGKFYIYGSHVQAPAPSGLIPLHIDAATAFGSGHHESTEGCLKALSLLAEQQSFSYPLDVGCGSGILALAMARLWKEPVCACDNDPEAVRVTKENAEINQLTPLIQVRLSDGFSGVKDQTFDLITANILAGPLCHMATGALHALRPDGFIVLSGLLNTQAEAVMDAYRSRGAKLVHQLFIGDWSTLIMRKESHG